MKTGLTEYTPGQLIRSEAVSLKHQAERLLEIMGAQPGAPASPTEAAREAGRCVRTDPDGHISGINRREQYYEDLTDLLALAREELEESVQTEHSKEAWLTVNRCSYHCTAILGMMEKQSRRTTRTAI